MRTELARQERTAAQAMGWRDLSRQISMAVRKLCPQLTAKESRGKAGLLAAKRSTMLSGGSEICAVSEARRGGMTTE